MKVEMDVFSGRPNPYWDLDAETSTALRALLARLGPTDRPAPEPPGLGYRGFVITDDDHRYRVYRTWVSSSRSTFLDPARSVEALLRDHIPDNLKSTLAGLV